MVNNPKRVLVCSYYPPESDREGGSKRVFDLVRLLRADNWAVTFLASERLGPARYSQALQRMGIPVFDGAKIRVEELLENARFDLVLFAYWPVAEIYLPMVRRALPQTHVVVDSVDLHFLRHARRLVHKTAEQGQAPALNPNFGSDFVRELNVYLAADAVLTVSQKEADLLKDLTGDPVLAKVVPDLEEPIGKVQPQPARKGMVFLGSFRHEPNIDAVKFLCQEIVPRLDRKLVEEHPIYVVGDKLDTEISRLSEGLPQVKMVGWVPSVGPYLQRARVNLIPLRYGAGTKRKFLQAVLAGTPSVSTSVGIEGFDVREGQEVLVANSPEEFAAAITRLFRDSNLWERLSSQARNQLRPAHERAAVRSRLREALSSVLASPSKGNKGGPVGKTSTPRRVNKYEYHQICRLVRELASKHLPVNARVLVVSRGDEHLLQLDGCTGWHFPRGEDGKYLGHHPADSAEAIARLEALKALGADFLLLPATSFWWLEHYQEFRVYLEKNCTEVVRQEGVCALYRLGLHRSPLDVSIKSQAGEGRQEVRLIAFYLPQFHPIPENDVWWGRGFTEWTNVGKARPLFLGHYQPHVPGELHYYDLREPEIRQAQASLARRYGIHGFCYYHYWFGGKRLLERPFQEVLDSGQPEFPFCLCWANEPWSRRWNGQPKDILQPQHYSERDDLAHIQSLLPALADDRAIRVEGKPLFLVYRGQDLPAPAQTLALWRGEVERAGLPGLHLVAVETGWDAGWDATQAGFDAKVLFQPQFTNLFNSGSEIRVPGKKNLRVFDYQNAWRVLAEPPPVSYRRYDTVCPMWDNSPRTGSNAVVLQNSTPAAYQEWLSRAIRKAQCEPPDHRLVFLNAWNEWGEGCHLEPDQKFGVAYLEATQRALLETSISTGPDVEAGESKAETTSKKQEVLLPGNTVDAKTGRSQPEAGNGWADQYALMLAAARGERHDEYVLFERQIDLPPRPAVKLIAFYLPQFHAIPENDAWWGRGFTEWTNVSKAVPQFSGHYQPHFPGELGFYDLRVNDVQRRQVELAKHYGLAGFCFYHYWFSGKRLLERPLEQFLADPSIDFPFCLCWANENWTRRWDGREEDILIGQNYCEKTDLGFIRDVEPMLRHRNYIRVDGRPLLMVYRAGLLPDPKATTTRWREYCRHARLEDPYLVAAQVFERLDPRELGFDGALEFPPNTPGARREISGQVNLLNREFSGHIHPYSDLAELTVGTPPPPYELFRTVCPSWDNEPRRPGRGTIYTGSTPQAYGQWLRQACETTVAGPDPDKHLVFINAWNEWGEGAHLEPDRRFGYGYLQATAEVLKTLPQGARTLQESWTILFVSHDACRAGAQRVLLNTIAWFKAHTSVRLKVICLSGGEWLPRFKELAETRLWSELADLSSPGADILPAIEDFCGGCPDLVFGNSVASGRVYEILSKLGVPILTHFHELEMSIQRYASGWIRDVVRHTAEYIACCGPVRDNLIVNHRVAPEAISTVLEFIQPDPAGQAMDSSQRAELRERLGLATNQGLVVGCGLGMRSRKGGDLFLEVAKHLRQQGWRDFHFYWIGDFEESEAGAREEFENLKRSEQAHVTFLGIQENPKEYFRAADVFLLPSREDPFPLVALEAAECGLPIVCFDKAGGMPNFVQADAGCVVPFADTKAMAEAVGRLLDNEAQRRTLGARARAKLLTQCTVDAAGPRILSACRRVAAKTPALSIIVPNFNHARYLRRRLDSIFNQTFRDFEVILLDDCSTDESVKILEEYSGRADVRLVRNEQNSGSTFKQWLKGIELARAEYLWIAESDDACEPDFIATLLPVLASGAVKLAYANSHVIDENDHVVGDYTRTEYLMSLSETKWNCAYRVSAEREINEGLGIKNTVLSASSALFRKFRMTPRVRRTLENLRIAGDWYFIINAIAGGEVYYTPRKLNYHRRHGESVVGKLLQQQRVGEFFTEFYTVHSEIFKRYRLVDGFPGKWKEYLQRQWQDFFPARPLEDMESYYPLRRATKQLMASYSRERAATEIMAEPTAAPAAVGL